MTESRKAREAEFVRSVFVDAAAEVFSEKGYHGATMDEIARTAGYSPAAIYRYFRGKDDIIRAVMDKLGEMILSIFDEPAPLQLTFADRLRWFLVREFRHAEDHRSLFQTYLVNRPIFERKTCHAVDHAAHDFHERYATRMASLMAEGIASGELRAGAAATFADAFIGITKGVTLRRLVGESTSPLTEHIETIVDLFLHGAGAHGPTPGAPAKGDG